MADHGNCGTGCRCGVDYEPRRFAGRRGSCRTRRRGSTRRRRLAGIESLSHAAPHLHAMPRRGQGGIAAGAKHRCDAGGRAPGAARGPLDRIVAGSLGLGTACLSLRHDHHRRRQESLRHRGPRNRKGCRAPRGGRRCPRNHDSQVGNRGTDRGHDVAHARGARQPARRSEAVHRSGVLPCESRRGRARPGGHTRARPECIHRAIAARLRVRHRPRRLHRRLAGPEAINGGRQTRWGDLCPRVCQLPRNA